MKAFDTVPHKRLIGKLRSYGISGKIVRWVTSFLLNRRQRVSVKGQFSAWADVLSEIPQRSVIGPILFVLYKNDLPDNMIFEVFMLADNTTMFREIRSNEDMQTLQKDLNNLQGWSNKVLMRFHPDKCKVMTISRMKKQDQKKYTMGKQVGNNIYTDHIYTRSGRKGKRLGSHSGL